MNGIINNGGLNAGRKGMKMRHKLEIIILLFMITVAAPGCIDSQKLPDSNETKIATPEPTPEHRLPTYNETKSLTINDTFETWSRGYWSNLSYKKPYFKIITNYSEWNEFLNNQGYFAGFRGGPRRLGGELFPGINTMPMKIEPADFNNYFIIAAMMGYKTMRSPSIEIKNIQRLNSMVDVAVLIYNPSSGESVESAPYHIVIVKKEVLPRGNSTFIFTDTEGKELGKVEVKE